MGMSIDEAVMHIMDVICENNTIKHSDLVVFDNEKQALRIAVDTMRKYQMMQADYNARLKADMVAMLEELISEANELEDPKYILETSELPLDVDGTTLPLETYALRCYCRGGEDVLDIIEKKISELEKTE